MRKWNAVISVIITVLFAIHLIMGGLVQTGFANGGTRAMRILTGLLMTLVLVHIVIGIKLTIDTAIAKKRSGVQYRRENRLFWLRRDSGFATMILLVFHLMLHMTVARTNRLAYFGRLQLIGQILLVAAVGVHVLTNIRPLMVSLGAKNRGKILLDILLVLSVLLIFAGISMIVYYLRWNVF